MKSYIKIHGPPVLKAIRALERMSMDFLEVSIMNSSIRRDISQNVNRDVYDYFRSRGVSVPLDRGGNIISKSGESLGEYDFFFEWLVPPSVEQLEDLIDRIDTALSSLGCHYTITTKE
ncbi:MAG: hypothetical protein ACXAEX_15295 [Promethearchaeota archaeon]